MGVHCIHNHSVDIAYWKREVATLQCVHQLLGHIANDQSPDNVGCNNRPNASRILEYGFSPIGRLRGLMVGRVLANISAALQNRQKSL